MHADATEASHYRLVCSVCGHRQPDDGLTLGCPEPHDPGLWKTDYRAEAFAPDDREDGVFRYRDWLPVRRTLPDTGRSTVYRSRNLAAFLGLSELWIAFNGYWPERGGDLTTGTFKELEAATVLGRLPENAGTLVVTSAGNTAAAFAELCARHRVPVAIVVPAAALPRLRTLAPASDLVRIVAVDGADYADAIALGDTLARLPGFTAEGGTRNVGRRDGLATVLLAAVEAMGGLPAYYVQAIGSGAGAIAAHEAALRLSTHAAASRQLPSVLPQLILAQNSCYAPVHQAWNSGVRPWERDSEREQQEQRESCEQSFAPELTNRRPPYDVGGGLCEALTQSAGQVFVADAPAARAAMETFRELEGIDIEPAAGVALAALRDAVRGGRIDVDGRILLNISGGGRERLAAEQQLTLLQPDLVVPREAFRCPEQMAEVAAGAAVRRVGSLAV